MEQYVRSKPHKWGIRVFAFVSNCRIIHDFEVYRGNGTVKTESKLDLSGEVVIQLSEIIQQIRNYKICMDKYCFTLFNLLLEHKGQGILTVGTVRINRLGGCQFIEDKLLEKKGRGSYDSRVDIENETLAYKWFDNKSMCLASSYVGAEPINIV